VAGWGRPPQNTSPPHNSNNNNSKCNSNSNGNSNNNNNSNSNSNSNHNSNSIRCSVPAEQSAQTSLDPQLPRPLQPDFSGIHI
jgi:hypothetical protein